MSLRLTLAAGLALIAGITASVYLDLSAPEKPDITMVLGDIELPDLEGKRQSLGKWQGKLVLLNFWATWCPPCIEEIPMFIELRKQNSAAGFEIIGVAIDDQEKIREFAGSMNIDYPLLYGQREGMTLMQKLGNPMGGLPYSVLFGRDGRVIQTKTGAYSHDELEKILKDFL